MFAAMDQGPPDDDTSYTLKRERKGREGGDERERKANKT
jgi:hypothetical protein